MIEQIEKVAIKSRAPILLNGPTVQVSHFWHDASSS